jgi:hypothetical protein
MEFQQNPAPQEGAPTELVSEDAPVCRRLTDHELRVAMKGKGTQHHVFRALRILDITLSQARSGVPHTHFKPGISFQQAFATRAALELIRRATRELEHQLRNAETDTLRDERARWNPRRPAQEPEA